MRSTRLTVPASDRFENPNVETRPAKVREWVEHLPYANRDGVIDTVIQAVGLLNRYPGPVSYRTELMDNYRAPCNHLFKMTPDQIGAPSFKQLRELVVEMAYGYKHVVNECLAQKKSWLSNRNKLITGIYFAVKYLSLDLLMAYECYQCKSDNNWREILPLYTLAEQQNLHLVKIEDPDQSRPEYATVSHLMKRIVLLSLLDPCHLQPMEARISYDYLNLGASLARLEMLGGQADVAGRFLLDMEGAKPARPFDPHDIPSDASRYRVLNVVPVSKETHRHLRQIEIERTPPPGGLQLLRSVDAIQILSRMLKSWHVRQERGSPRQDAFGCVALVSGLHGIHRFLSSRGQADGLSSREETSQGGRDAQGLRCHRLNASESGIALRLGLPCDPQPQVGQLVLMQDETDLRKPVLEAGIIRRCLRIDDDTLELGIQFIRGRVKAVAFRPMSADSKETGYQSGLFIHEGADQLGSLLVARGLYQEGREFLIEEADPAPLVTAIRLIESGPDFDRFHVHDPGTDWAS
jgi:hypothetical protein